MLAISTVLIGWTGFVRTRDRTGIRSERFWIMKLEWKGCADAVLAGDSRAVISVPPLGMFGELPELRILNYGFSGAAYTSDYLDGIAPVLDPNSPDRNIILAVTPRAFTEFAAQTGEFGRQWKRSKAKELLAEARWAFQRIQLKRLVADWLPGRPIRRDFRHRCADGWVAMYVENPCRTGALAHYEELFSAEDVVPEMIDDLLDHVHTWTADGIRVCGFRPPCSPEMLALENRLSIFDEAEFITRFESAGGIWIEVEQNGYDSFDGSHLTWPEALEFSRDLAYAIRRIRAGENPAAVRAIRGGTKPELPPEWYAHLPARFHAYYQSVRSDRP